MKTAVIKGTMWGMGSRSQKISNAQKLVMEPCANVQQATAMMTERPSQQQSLLVY